MRGPWLTDARVWIVLDREASSPNSVVETTLRAIEGGVDAVVCRLKELPFNEMRERAREVREACAAHGTPFVMSHFPELAVELNADAVQIGVDDPEMGNIREQVGDEMLIGYSAHSIGEAQSACESGADYVFLGPVFATPRKLKYGDPLGIDVVQLALDVVKCPMVTIGGINTENLTQLMQLGVNRVAAIAALQHDCDPAAAVRQFKSMLDGQMG